MNIYIYIHTHNCKQKDRQCTSKRNTEVPASNICCRGRTISITYSERVSAALFIQHGVRTRHIVICGLSDCTTFFRVN